ncbi:MAG: zinc ribbon domain-containing protein [Anaerolineae bacterium]|nr:zinc ribbon domain-containing protein [Anaerolineae bacterium]
MPIYEYYCQVCYGRFSHLAREFDAPAPPCPRCGNQDVERLVSAVNVVHPPADHQAQLRAEAAAVDDRDLQAAAQLLQASGRLEDAEGLYGSRAYKELIARRAAGASDSDLGDLVDNLVAATQQSDATETAAAMALSKQVDNRLGADGPAEGHEHGRGLQTADAGHSEAEHTTPGSRSRRSAPNLGWG